jgi:tetratricopeptide (TPR) repeat protein
MELLRHGIELFPERSELVDNLAYILATTADDEIRNPQQAIEMLERVRHTKDSEDYRVLYTLSVALGSMNRIDEALDYARKAEGLAREAEDQGLLASIGRHIAVLEQTEAARVN